MNYGLKSQFTKRDLCIHMAPRRPETNSTSWATAYPQKYVPEQTAAYSQEYISDQAVAYQQEYIPKLATAYPQKYIHEQTTTYTQEYIPEQAAANPEESASEAITWDNVLTDLLSNMPEIVDSPNEELVPEFIVESLI